MKELFSQIVSERQYGCHDVMKKTLLGSKSPNCYIKQITENKNNDNSSEEFRCSRVLLLFHILSNKFILRNLVPIQSARLIVVYRALLMI